MHYRGIVDSPDDEWYDAELDKDKSLDVNDFLHDVNLFVTNRLLSLNCAPATIATQLAPSTFALLVQFIEGDIFEFVLEMKRL